MNHHYAWLIWSSAFLAAWVVVYWATPRLRGVMWRASAATAVLGLTEPIFVPSYWNPPSLFELTRRTGFDIESVIYAFAIGGIGSVLYYTFTPQHMARVSAAERTAPLHRLHLAALLVPFVAFIPLYFVPWNPIYPVLVSFVLGAIASVICRPALGRKTVIGAMLFLGLYTAFMLGLRWLAPGYIAEVWNLPALRGGLIFGIPVEELLFGLTFGAYWTGVYEHFTWSESVAHAAATGPTKTRPPAGSRTSSTR